MPTPLLAQLSLLLRETMALEILPRFQRLAPGEVIAKSSDEDPTDLVTVADHAAEAHLTERLPAFWPGSVVIGEEAAAAEPALLARLAASRPVWVVDPLDGTRNFAAGRGPFGTMVALVERGELLAAAIYLPLTDELVTAERSHGAYHNGVRLGPPPGAPGERLRGTIYGKFLPVEVRAPLLARAFGHQLVPGVSCAAIEYVAVALGRKDYVVYHRLLPWDHAPGALIVREAGGVVRHPGGRDYQVSDLRELLLVTTTTELWDRAHTELFSA